VPNALKADATTGPSSAADSREVQEPVKFPAKYCRRNNTWAGLKFFFRKPHQGPLPPSEVPDSQPGSTRPAPPMQPDGQNRHRCP